MKQELIEDIVKQVLISLETSDSGIPVGVSNRHIHLSAEHMECLFGSGRQLTKKKDLSQIGEFAAEETVTLVGSKGTMRGVRVLGPLRKKTQVEVSRTDAFALGVQAPLCDSGNTEGSAGIVLVGPCGAINLSEGVIRATRHIHMNGEDAKKYGVNNGDMKTVEIGGRQGGCFKNVLIRVNDNFRLEFHIDTDEANAMGLKNGDKVTLS